MKHTIDVQMKVMREESDLTEEELARYEETLYLYHDPMNSATL